MTRLTRTLLAVSLAVASIGGCSTGKQAPSASGAGMITVYAGQALRLAFGQMGEQFSVLNIARSVDFNFGFSPYLLSQLTRGAYADVFAAGDAADMDAAARAGLLATAPVSFATNTLAILVAPGNPKKILALSDLNRPGLKVAVCATRLDDAGPYPVGGLPCGTALDTIEQSTGMRLDHATAVPRTEDVLQKVINGDVDAGVAFASDANSGGAGVSWVRFPEAAHAVVTYSIAVLKTSKNPELARRFVEFVTGEPGRAQLAVDGFGAP